MRPGPKPRSSRPRSRTTRISSRASAAPWEAPDRCCCCALDMKGTNAAFMAALLRHLSEGARFDRDIIFLADCDEEAGPNSTRWLAERHYDKIDAGAVITEGGWALAPPGSVEPVVVTLTRQDK